MEDVLGMSLAADLEERVNQGVLAGWLERNVGIYCGAERWAAQVLPILWDGVPGMLDVHIVPTSWEGLPRRTAARTMLVHDYRTSLPVMMSSL